MILTDSRLIVFCVVVPSRQPAAGRPSHTTSLRGVEALRITCSAYGQESHYNRFHILLRQVLERDPGWAAVMVGCWSDGELPDVCGSYGEEEGKDSSEDSSSSLLDLHVQTAETADCFFPVQKN